MGVALDIFTSQMGRGRLACVICNSNSFSFLYIQTLHNYRSYIEDSHLLFCIHFMIFFAFGFLENFFSVKC